MAGRKSFMSWENSIDNSEYGFVRRLLTLKDFGFALLIVCVQELIARGWCSLRFKQILEGETIYADVIADTVGIS